MQAITMSKVATTERQRCRWGRAWWRCDDLVADNWSGRRLGAQVGYLSPKPLELGSLLRTQSGLRFGGTVLVAHSGTIPLQHAKGHHPWWVTSNRSPASLRKVVTNHTP